MCWIKLIFITSLFLKGFSSSWWICITLNSLSHSWKSAFHDISSSDYKVSPVYVCVLSCIQLFATLWTAAHQAPLSMEFSRQEYWRGLPLQYWRSFSRGSSRPRDQTCISYIGRRILYHFTTSIHKWTSIMDYISLASRSAERGHFKILYWTKLRIQKF